MVQSKAKVKKVSRRPGGKSFPDKLNPLRTGMPAPDSITGVDEYRKGKKILRIIHTTERDEYDKR